ncbi:PilC/PilY family type IV pilus protein [Syntrophotalea acetylenica]|uniref:PilC/PilY family type IV pilus protein n=1 Tax=Syntrophotalea acetylenica TaxID=29542 RepID=UPI002A358769|nr:PilC/PilY family type IV pilus protein [Syntrophotalea acetylenica]MDY0262680.1 PilC/PilY family type IV pilus protein [Syntrophotalea acetylenica]
MNMCKKSFLRITMCLGLLAAIQGVACHDPMPAFAQDEILVSVSFDGDGNGKVTLKGSLGGACTLASDGSCTFAQGERITLYANASVGSEFLGWSGGHTGSEKSFSMALSQAESFTADFGLAADAAVPGCGSSTYTDYASGFAAQDFSLNNVTVTEDGYLHLETGNDAIDPNSIIVPFEQEVAVTFLHEGAGYDESDFGWMLASEGSGGTRHEVYTDVNDNNANGVLDDREGIDANGDGLVNAFDNRVSLGTFAAGTELVFYLKVDNDSRKPTYFTKMAWNPDTYGGDCSNGTKIFNLGIARNASTDTCQTTGWLDNEALTRAKNLFDLQFSTADTQSMEIIGGEKYPHVIVGAPGNKPNEWILGWEDLWRGGDTDHNDMVFIVERRTGGVAQLKSSEAIEPDEEGAFYTAVEIEVWDSMPCSGQSAIDYYVSIDNGVNWVEVSTWDTVRSFTVDGNGLKQLGSVVASWTPGTPRYTCRTRRIDFAGQGITGRQLIWKAVLSSEDEACAAEILDVNLTGTVATHGEISRSSPVAVANVLYSGSYETPAVDWAEKELRGHLRAMRTYDALSAYGTDNVELWDAGAVLSARAPSSRTIYYPTISLDSVVDEELATADGVTEGFGGTLAHAPVVGESVVIAAGTETFTDRHTDKLVGSMGGTGTINRFTGEWQITPHAVVGNGIPIKASYKWYATSSILVPFTATNIDNSMLGLDNTYVVGAGYRYDFNKDNAFTQADGAWLVNWVRGYADGGSVKKTWVLDPLDHSVPAVVTPPSRPAWYYGAAVTETERDSFDAFVTAHSQRDTVVLVGSRSGMLHAFNAGQFRWGDNTETPQRELRGYYLWDDDSSVTSWWSSFLSGYPDTSPETSPPFFTWQTRGSKAPDYGDGQELWAFIPANLLSRLKNNYLKGEDRAFVDASPAVADVHIGGAWKTVVLCAEGNGGDSVFALDITDTRHPTFMWEFADPDLFRSRSSPAVAVLGKIVAGGKARWAAFFVSGKTNDGTLFPSVYIIDIADGSVIERIFLNCEPAGVGGVPSGQPAIVDSDGNGYIDRLYIGTDKGYMYKVNLPDLPGSVAYPISQCVINTDFDYVRVNDQGTEDTADDVSTTMTVPENQRYHSIYASPTVVVDNSLNSSGALVHNVRIFFGSGDSPYVDEDIDTGNTSYHFFAYADHAAKGSTEASDVELAWFEALPAGHRIFASAYAAAGSVYFGTATSDTEDPCGGPNEGRIYAFSYSGLSLLSDSAGQQGLEVGDIITAPLVEDQHLYFKTPDGLKSLGSNQYNNPTRTGGLPYSRVRSWREVF